eukprot:Skav210518  [mRNA]  locus=scaffold3045:118998:120385:+ [translate_table: standard]
MPHLHRHDLQSRKAGACSDGKGNKISEEVLVFAAEEGHVSLLTRAVATVHQHYHRHLKVESFKSLLRKDGNSGILTSATAGWIGFLRGFSGVLQERVGASIVELLASAWVQNFVQAPPPLSLWGSRLFVSFAKDEESLRSLAADSRELETFRQVLSTMRAFLQVSQARGSNIWEELGKAEDILQKLLAEEQGRALTRALWQTATS